MTRVSLRWLVKNVEGYQIPLKCWNEQSPASTLACMRRKFMEVGLK